MGFGRRLLRAVTDPVERIPRATQVFATTLASGVKKELSTPGSTGSRFADAPLGQFYLPQPARKVLGLVVPSPRKVTRDTANVAQHPSAGTVAAVANDVLSVAALPAVATGVGTATRAGRIAAATRELPLGERLGLAARGALNPDALFHGTTQSAAKAIRSSGFKAGDVFLTRQPGVASVYAGLRSGPRSAIAGVRGAQIADRPAIVLAKISKGASVAKKGENYAEVVKSSDALPLSRIIKMSRRLT